MNRVGILTSGGDCPGLNPAIRGVCKAVYKKFGENNIQIYGFLNGYKGLIDGNYKILNPSDFSGIINLGGTILGTSRQPFKKMRVIEDDKVDKIKQIKSNYDRLGLDCIVVLGGNGTQKTANLLSEEGLNIISLPKTIDNDIWGTDVTFGFQSAVNLATQVIDCIHTTACSHGRVFVVEIMGHKVGWLTLYAGIAAGADVILIPEIPYDLERIAESVEKRHKQGKEFSIIAVAEGANAMENSSVNKKYIFDVSGNGSQMTDSYKIADGLKDLINKEIKVTIPGHFQRGGNPCPYDRVLATEFGTAAAKLIEKGDYGKMVSLTNNKITSVALKDIAGKLKYVPIDCDEVKSASDIGIGFGV